MIIRSEISRQGVTDVAKATVHRSLEALPKYGHQNETDIAHKF